MNFFEKLFQKPWEEDKTGRTPRKRAVRVKAVLAAEIAPSPERERNPEKIVELGTEVLGKEDEGLDSRKISPLRKHGFMLATALAMVMATLGAPEKAQAQWRSVGGSFADQAIGRTLSSVKGSVDRAHGKKIDGIESGYIGQLQEIEDRENEIFSAYNRQRERLESAGKKAEINRLDQEYRIKKEEIAQMKLDLRKKYNGSKAKADMQGMLINGAIRISRGW